VGEFPRSRLLGWRPELAAIDRDRCPRPPPRQDAIAVRPELTSNMATLATASRPHPCHQGSLGGGVATLPAQLDPAPAWRSHSMVRP